MYQNWYATDKARPTRRTQVRIRAFANPSASTFPIAALDRWRALTDDGVDVCVGDGAVLYADAIAQEMPSAVVMPPPLLAAAYVSRRRRAPAMPPSPPPPPT